MTVWAWGSGFNGQVGNGKFETNWPGAVYVPVPSIGLSSVKAIAAGYTHSAALTADGRVWTWGWNNQGELGDGTNVRSHTPTRLLTIAGVTAIDAKYETTRALKGDGTVWSWGDGQCGILGNGVDADSNLPVQAIGLADAVAISAGGPGLALKSDGTVWAWGSNYKGALGIGTDDPPIPCTPHLPVQVIPAWDPPAPDVTPNSLRGVRSGADSSFTWGSSATGTWNVHRSEAKSDLATLWLAPVLASTATLGFADPTPAPAPGMPWLYQAFGADCEGLSQP